MSVLDKLATSQGRRDEAPNQELALQLAHKKDRQGIQELVDNLPNRKLQNDCIKVLYEVGEMDPLLIGDYAPEFLRLLSSRNNRLVWGGMTALATIALIRSKEIAANLDPILKAIENGSVITVDNGVRVLARAASTKPEHNKKIFPHLLDHLKHCRSKEIPQHAESTMPAVTRKNKKEFIATLDARRTLLTPAQAKRVTRVINQAESI